MKSVEPKARLLMLTVVLTTTLLACSASGTSSGTNEVVQPNPTQPPNPAAVATSTAPSAGTAGTAAKALDSKAKPHELPVAGSPAAEIPIVLNGTSITVDHSSVSSSGARVQITAPGTYRLSGTLSNGQIRVNTAAKGTVKLLLDGVTIHNETGAAIDIIDADTAVIELAANTQNTVSDGANYVFAAPDADEPNATIFSKADLTIDGTGALTVRGNFSDGVASKDGLVIANGHINVTATDDGIRGKDYLVVKDGDITITAKGDGLKSDEDADPQKGYVAIEKGTLSITAGSDAIRAQTDVLLVGGRYTLITGGGSGGPRTAVSQRGIRAEANVTIDGGQFAIDAAEDALHANGTITINAGVFDLSAGDDGVHSDTQLVINGGSVRVAQSYEGIESVVVTLNGGQIDIASSDDGINAADGTAGGPGGRPGGRLDPNNYTGNKFLYINGGTIVVNSGGDGVDSNGAVEMKGGTLVVHGPSQRMNAALDYDAFFKISGGTLVAAGSSGMAQAPGTQSQQNSVIIFFTEAQQAGTLVHIRDGAGQGVLTFAPSNDFQSLAFSSAGLANGARYDIVLGGSAIGAASNGLYAADVVYSAGTVFQSFTVNSVVTTVGTPPRRRFGP
jgi:hypothetical protein